MSTTVTPPTNHWDYIRVEELLDLQKGLEPDEAALSNDEVLFITVHQVFELWFKLTRRELTSLRDFFRHDPVEDQAMSNAVRSIRRVVQIFRQAIDHFEVMETLTTRAYLAFRDKLSPASGFQSAQMRQIEILLGLADEDRISLGQGESYIQALRSHDGSPSSAMKRVLAQKEDGPSLREAVEEWLYRTPIDGVGPDDPGAEEVLASFVRAYLEAQASEVDRGGEIALARARSEETMAALRQRYEDDKANSREFLSDADPRRQRIRAAALFILTYRELPLLAWPREVLDGLIEMEQVMVIFRQRHARMVERVLGRRTGTGGSSGVDYLDDTARAYRVFRDLWAVRAYQIRRAAAPELGNPEFYDFRNAEH